MFLHDRNIAPHVPIIRMNYKKIHPCTIIMKLETIHRDQICSFVSGCKHVCSCCEVGHLNMGVYGELTQYWSQVANKGCCLVHIVQKQYHIVFLESLQLSSAANRNVSYQDQCSHADWTQLTGSELLPCCDLIFCVPICLVAHLTKKDSFIYHTLVDHRKSDTDTALQVRHYSELSHLSSYLPCRVFHRMYALFALCRKI